MQERLETVLWGGVWLTILGVALVGSAFAAFLVLGSVSNLLRRLLGG